MNLSESSYKDLSAMQELLQMPTMFLSVYSAHIYESSQNYNVRYHFEKLVIIWEKPCFIVNLIKDGLQELPFLPQNEW